MPVPIGVVSERARHLQARGLDAGPQNLGHASLATTTVYVRTEKRRRMKAVEAF